MMPEPTANLGHKWDWKETPVIVKHCRSMGHEVQRTNETRTLVLVYCPVCRYKYNEG